MKRQPFMAAPGSDPSAVMKGDIPQHVDKSTAPGSKPKRPQPVRAGNFSLRREHRSGKSRK
jgi:hypothetical protein